VKEYLEDINIELDVDKGLFYSRDLDYYEEEYLKNHKYKTANFVPIGKVRQEEAWLLPTPPESLIHTFIVRNTRDELLKYTSEVQILKSREPDIIFRNKKGQIIALEIETGKGFKKHKARLIEKFTEAKAKYKKNLFIILTNSNMKRKYKSQFPNITILARTDLPGFLHTQLKKIR